MFKHILVVNIELKKFYIFELIFWFAPPFLGDVMNKHVNDLRNDSVYVSTDILGTENNQHRKSKV